MTRNAPDTLILKGLQYEGKHGFYKEERKQGNRFEVDLTFKLDLRKAGKEDDLSMTVNYEQAEKMVREIMKGPSVKLIETLAVKIGDSLFEAFPEAIVLEVTVRKLRPALDTPVNHSEVRMSWQR